MLDGSFVLSVFGALGVRMTKLGEKVPKRQWDTLRDPGGRGNTKRLGRWLENREKAAAVEELFLRETQ